MHKCIRVLTHAYTHTYTHSLTPPTPPLALVWLYALDRGGDMSASITMSNNTISSSPYNALFLVGNSISGLKVEDTVIDGAKSFAFQLRGTRGPG